MGQSVRQADARSPNGTPMFRRVCADCGSEAMVDRRRIDKPCFPCAMKARATHGGCGTAMYRRYTNMVARCVYPSATNYAYYGGRGIKVCAEWMESFEAFRDWALANGWDEALEIDRISSDGDYSPTNCRFISHAKNSRGRRNARVTQEQADEIRGLLDSGATVNGVSKQTGHPYMTVWHIKNSGTWRRE